MDKKFGFSFSWKRAPGVAAAKGRVSRKIGIPQILSGRQRQVGRAAGCLVIYAAIIGMPFCLAHFLTLGGFLVR